MYYNVAIAMANGGLCDDTINNVNKSKCQENMGLDINRGCEGGEVRRGTEHTRQ